jgi:hypothetical protein
MKRVALLVAAVLLAGTAGCTGGSTAAPEPTGGHVPETAPTPTSRSYATKVQERDRQTIAYADGLAANAPRIANEDPFTGKPPKDISNADETIGVSNLVIRAHYWTAPGTPDKLYRALKKIHTPGLRLTGHGLPSSPAVNPPGQGFLHWDPTHPPSYIADVELYVEMEQLTRGRVIIAAFGEAAAHPVRFPAETISLPSSVVATKSIHTMRGEVQSERSISFTPEQARAFTNAFNASPTSPPGTCIGGIGPRWMYRTVIRSDGHTWKLSYPGSSCFGVGVERDDQSLNNLQPSVEFRRILRLAFLVDRGIVHGHLLAVGGPTGTSPAHIYGHLTLSQDGRTIIHRRTNGAGAFSFSAPTGRFTLTGGSSYVKVDGHDERCAAPHDVIVRANQETTANIYCQRR